MATNASAASIGNIFVLKYYTMLNNDPSNLFHFYREHSGFTYGYEEESKQTSEDTIQGLENIKKKIKSLEFENCSVSLSVVDCQESQGDGVLVSVIGALSNKGKPFQRFIQVFFLAPQTNGYYVLNDNFRYLKDTIPTVEPSIAHDHKTVQHAKNESKPTEEPIVKKEESTPVQVSKPTEAKEEKVEEKKKEEKPSTPSTQETKEKTPVPTSTTPSTPPTKSVETGQKPKFEKKKNEKNQNRNKQNKEQPQQPVATSTPSTTTTTTSLPGTWANLVHTLYQPGDKMAQNQTQPPIVKPQAVVSPQEKSPVSQAKPPVKNATPQTQKKSDKEKSPKALAKEFSVYVSNIPFASTEDQIKSAFVGFGEIKNITLRALKGYCFLEYATIEQVHSVVAAAKANPIVMDERTLTVEEKKPKSDLDKKFKTEKKKGDGKFPKERNGENRERNGDKKRGGKESKPKKPYLKESLTQTNAQT